MVMPLDKFTVEKVRLWFESIPFRKFFAALRTGLTCSHGKSAANCFSGCNPCSSADIEKYLPAHVPAK
jgi:hypothetical protein